MDIHLFVDQFNGHLIDIDIGVAGFALSKYWGDENSQYHAKDEKASVVHLYLPYQKNKLNSLWSSHNTLPLISLERGAGSFARKEFQFF
jgi:hypothetical protein